MPVPDGFLDAPTSVATAVVAAGGTRSPCAGPRRELDELTTPLAGLAAAFVFAAQMLNFPGRGRHERTPPRGSARCRPGRPWTGALCLATVLLVQAFLFADGSITALGTHVTLMGLVGVGGAARPRARGPPDPGSAHPRGPARPRRRLGRRKSRLPLRVHAVLALVLPFLATGGRVEVVGVSVSGPGLVAAGTLVVKGTLGVLAHAYPDGHQALFGVDLHGHRGERVAQLGRNGAGKTTLVLHLNGSLTAGAGSIAVSGLPVTKPNLAEVCRRVGIVFQDPDDQLFMPTVRDDVEFGPATWACGAQSSRTPSSGRSLVGMEEYADRPPHHLSFGQRRRVAVATVLVMEPEILVLASRALTSTRPRAASSPTSSGRSTSRSSWSPTTCPSVSTHGSRGSLVPSYAPRRRARRPAASMSGRETQ